jgi:hypothetical protein
MSCGNFCNASDNLMSCSGSVAASSNKVAISVTGVAATDAAQVSCRPRALLPTKYIREETLEARFTELLGRLRFDDEVLQWVREALHTSHADERREHEEAIKRHHAEYKRLDVRVHAMHIDKLDGLVDTAFFERMSNQWREEQNRCLREIERHQNADKILSGRRRRAS